MFETIVNHGYKVGLAKDGPEIIRMVSDDRYNVILTNGGYGELNPNHHTFLKSSSVFIIGITNSHKQTQDLKADVYLPRPFLISELWRTIETPLQLSKE